MEKIFITGGSGTVGTSFIENNSDKYEIHSFSRNEKAQVALKRKFPSVNIILGSIEDQLCLERAVRKINPQIIVHTAALKHVDSAEKQPIEMVKTNIVGSKNIIDISLKYNVPITIGISTDKACKPKSIYGYSKLIMERMFMEANNEKNIFCCTRFGNVAGSNGSVIPFWINKHNIGEPIPVTDKLMNRLMITGEESSRIIEKCIYEAKKNNGGFVLSRKMKNVVMIELARLISSKIKIIGLRPGESLNEDLISDYELPYTVVEKDYIYIYKDVNKYLNTRLKLPISSKNSPKMNEEELLLLLQDSKKRFNNTMIY